MMGMVRVRCVPLSLEIDAPLAEIQAGVGTGPLDRITGGGLGLGLEKHVRDAYNWLVENYSDADPEKPDEVYIFGFSRGAYTARSLVGFIGECGLLRRGAPLTVAELWDAYCILGREREKRTSAWDYFFKKPEAPIRQISSLKIDSWIAAKNPNAYRVQNPRNSVEERLIKWSRRIQITYLGVYDTVGAIGWDALAIPGLTSRIALHNNMRPTKIIQNCRHALAIDEHRSSFNHTPFVSYIGLGAADPEAGRNTACQTQVTDRDGRLWEQRRKEWDSRFEQQWFVGAHSNIGGGYDNNPLAQSPLEWVLTGAPLHLSAQPVWDRVPDSKVQKPRDSFAEFAPPLWTKMLRAKRNYRMIDPDPLLNASPGAAASKCDPPPAGHRLESINESIHPTVFDYWEKSGLPLPPNLWDYRTRRRPSAAKPPLHSWPGDRLSDFVAVVIWATLAAAGLASLCQLIGLEVASGWHLAMAYIAAFIFPLVDFSESLINFKQACGIGSPRFHAFLDSVYWTRSLGFVLFVCGAVNSIHYLG